MLTDVRKRELGSFFGGKRGHDRSVACPVCGEAALVVSDKYAKTGDKKGKYAHTFMLFLNASNEPECQYGQVCDYDEDKARRGFYEGKLL